MMYDPDISKFAMLTTRWHWPVIGNRMDYPFCRNRCVFYVLQNVI